MNMDKPDWDTVKEYQTGVVGTILGWSKGKNRYEGVRGVCNKHTMVELVKAVNNDSLEQYTMENNGIMASKDLNPEQKLELLTIVSKMKIVQENAISTLENHLLSNDGHF